MFIQPSLSLLKDEHVHQIHQYTLDILSKVGLRVDSERARKCFIKRGCRFEDPNRIYVEPDMVAWALNAVPSTIDIYDRLGQHVFCLGEAGAKTRFGIGVTNLNYQDPETDVVTPFTRKHMTQAARLGNTLEQFDIISTPGVLREVSEKEADLYATIELHANTTKPLVILISEPDQYRNVLVALEHLHGDLREKPFIIPYFNPVTPLALNGDTTDKMFTSIEFGLPFIFSNYGMSGATTPITPAGTLVTLNAELLGGLILGQLIKEGTPMLLGSLPSAFNMMTMITAYTPQTMLLNLACAEMMAHYGVPHVGTSGSGAGWGPDLTAAGVLWMNHLTSCMGKVGLAPFVGGNFDSLVFSPAMVVYADEIIRQSRLFTEGFELNDESVGMDEIMEIGPGGSFLTTRLTLEFYKEMSKEHSLIWPSYPLEEWQAKGLPKSHDILIERTCSILENLKVPEDQEEMLRKGEEFVKQLAHRQNGTASQG